MTKNTTKTTTVKDAARYFWGKKEFETALKTEHENVESDICMLSDSFSTNGSLMIYSAGALEFEPVKNSRYCDLPREQIKPVIMPYINASVCAKIPASMFGHLAAEHSKKIYLAAAGRWCSFVANDVDHGMHMEDGADMGDFFNLGGIKATFDGSEVAKIFKKFKVDCVEICRPSKGSDFMRFYVTFKGAKFTAILLKCYRDDYNADFEDEAAALVTEWDAQDVSVAPAPVEAVATYPAATVATCEAPRSDAGDQESEPDPVRVVHNAEYDSTEIYFNEKPAKETRDALKNAGFRWHGAKLCWYSKKMGVDDARALVMGDNRTEMALEGENARGGAEVHQEAETATEANETVKRDISKEFRRGDVVKITGTTNGRNGYFYVVDLHADGTPYKLQGLKKCPKYDTFKDETTKNVEYWPLHTYANSPNVRAEFKEAVKFAKISNFGPVSLAAYQAMKRAHAETVEGLERVKGRDGSGVYVDEWTKREAEERADLERMERENESLKGLDQWKVTHKKPEGPGLKICKNGLKVRNDDGTWEHYSLRIEKAHGYHNDAHAGEVEVWGSYYGNRRSTIPEGFGLEIINDSDSQTDYFEADRAFVKPDHPLFWAFAQAAEGGKPHTLTDDDAKRCAEYLEGKRAAAEAERKAKEDAERAERERKEAELCRAISDAVETYSEEFPAVPGEATGRIIWSENNALYAESEETGKNTLFSLAALDLIISEADHAKKRIFGNECGYEKTKIVVEIPGGVELEERVDIGDGIGGIYENHMHTLKWHMDQALNAGNDENWKKAQAEGMQREGRILEMLRPWCHIGGLLVLNDLEALELGETA